MKKQLTYSAAIPTKNRPEELRRCLGCVLSQRPAPEKIIILDDGNLDEADIRSWLGPHANLLIYHRKKKPGLVKSLNLAMDLCQSEWLLLLDDDIYLEKDFMKLLIDTQEESDNPGNVAGLTGYAIVPGLGKRSFRTVLRLFMEHIFLLGGGKEGCFLKSGFCTEYSRGYHPSHTYRVEHIGGGLGLWRTEVIRQFRHDTRFGKGYALGSDKDMAYRISRKYILLCNPAARATHDKSPRSRTAEFEFGKMKVHNQFLFYRNSFQKNFFSPLFFYWAMTGRLILDIIGAVFSSKRGNQMKVVRGMLNAFGKEIFGGNSLT